MGARGIMAKTNKHFAKKPKEMAEGKGFEPPKGISSFNDLANRRLQPLGHPSAGDMRLCTKIIVRAHV